MKIIIQMFKLCNQIKDYSDTSTELSIFQLINMFTTNISSCSTYESIIEVERVCKELRLLWFEMVRDFSVWNLKGQDHLIDTCSWLFWICSSAYFFSHRNSHFKYIEAYVQQINPAKYHFGCWITSTMIAMKIILKICRWQ